MTGHRTPRHPSKLDRDTGKAGGWTSGSGESGGGKPSGGKSSGGKSGAGKPRGKKPGLKPAAFQEREVNSEGREVVSIFGVHAVLAALNNPARTVTKLMMSENAQRRLADAVTQRGVTPETVTPKALDRILGADTVHQGVLLETVALDAPELEDLAEAVQSRGPIVVLDQVTDPHNVGAVMRSAAVFGSAGLIMTRRNSPALSGVLAKSASGALELVPVHLCGNLSRTLDALKSLGIDVIGLDGSANTVIEDVAMTGACAVVLGAEGKGLRQLTRDTCSQIARIEGAGDLASLNVSNAAAVTLHLAAMRRRGISFS